MKKSKKIVIGAVIIALLIALFFLKSLYDAGAFKTVVSLDTCRCEKVPVLTGPEDIAVDAEKGVAYVSSGNWRKLVAGLDEKGAIYAYDLVKKGAPVDLTADIAFSFHPHGISFYRGADGKALLYVVNHRTAKKGDSAAVRHCVELFEIDGGALVHRESFCDKSMNSPNDVAAAGPRSFYFTNDHGAPSAAGRTIEDYLRLKWSNIIYFDGGKYSEAAKGLAYVNGVFVSPDGKKVYAATTMGREFLSYARGEDGKLTLESSLRLGTNADNVDISSDGRIFVGCHPDIIAFLKFKTDPKALSPSEVLEMVPDGKGWRKSVTYLDDGRGISGSSVGAVWKDRLLVGSVFADYFLDCVMKKK